MFFYRIEAKVTNPDLIEIQGNENFGFSKILKIVPQSLDRQNNKEGIIFVSSLVGDDKVFMGALAKSSEWLDYNLQGFITASELQCCDIYVDEVTLSEFGVLLQQSEKHSYSCFNSETTVYRNFGLLSLKDRPSIDFKEFILKMPYPKKRILNEAKELLCADTMIPELERIYQLPKEPVQGHPVHYFIQCDNNYMCDDIYGLLITALFTNKRVLSRKHIVASMSEKNFDKNECKALFEACTGGVLVIKCGEKIEGELTPEERLLRAIFGEKFGNSNDDETNIYWLSAICKMALEYRDKTLTIFCLPRTSERVKRKMREELDIMTLVDIAENFVTKECAKKFLKQAANKRNIKTDKSLYRIVHDEQTAFSSTELLRAFDIWYSKRLKSYSYPQYASFATTTQIIAKSAHKGDAYAELGELIGLNEVKCVVKQALDYFKAQRLLCDRGLAHYRPSMHMVFSGTPGTAKTTVARLIARILRENELLSVGKLYEVGRSDLVGQYVGWTAQKVESKFAEAMGSVLFIDEAYSLVDDRDGCYGDEAISTIVTQMENRREDIVVIFAGYTEKIEGFLQKNPGLRSRVSFHISFPDYSPPELYQILEYIAEKQSLILDDEVKHKVMPMLVKASCEPDFGNGRYVRNLIEKARMKQAGRLLEMDINSVTTDQATRLLAEDFEAPMVTKEKNQRIGFYCA